MNLQQVQTDFQRIVLEEECTGANWVDSSRSGLNAQSRIAIYHNAYRVRLIEVLRDTFEHTSIYLGDDWFNQLASQYVQSHPSTYNNIALYGQKFPDFLAKQLSDDLEVAELAELDWLLRRAFDGKDSEAMTIEHLQHWIASQNTNNCLSFVPTFCAIKQHYNTLDIWQAINQDDQPPVIEKLSQPIDILVWRKGHSPHFRSVSNIESQAVTYMHSHYSLDAIGAALSEDFPTLDVATEFGVILRHWIDDEMLSVPSAQQQ